MTYLITFACYGAHVHGDELGSVDRNHNVPGHRTLEPDAARAAQERILMKQARYEIGPGARRIVLDAIREVCMVRSWLLLAAHVRTAHVHVVVEAEIKPEMAMNTFKAYASRRLNQLGTDAGDRKRWARHGSTRWLWNRDDVAAAIRYVIDGQGEPMEVYVA